MTGIEARIMVGRLELHLRKNNFVVCKEILEEAEKEYAVQCVEGAKEVTAIAELKISLGTITLLEKKGYIHLEQLDGVDITQLYKKIDHLSKERALLLYNAVEKGRRHNAVVRQSQELESLEQ